MEPQIFEILKKSYSKEKLKSELITALVKYSELGEPYFIEDLFTEFPSGRGLKHKDFAFHFSLNKDIEHGNWLPWRPKRAYEHFYEMQIRISETKTFIRRPPILTIGVKNRIYYLIKDKSNKIIHHSSEQCWHSYPEFEVGSFETEGVLSFELSDILDYMLKKDWRLVDDALKKIAPECYRQRTFKTLVLH